MSIFSTIFYYCFPYLGNLEPELVCCDGGEGFSGPGQVVVGQVVVEAGTSEH